MKLKEIHSSDLTASCMKYVQLRFAGKTRPAATTALFRGLVSGEAMRLLHERHLHGKQEPDLYSALVQESCDLVRKTLASEGRAITEAVEKNMSEILSDIGEVAENYRKRFAAKFERWTLLGCEVPVRWKFAPRMPEFASHIDCLLRDEHGQLVVLDWKYRDQSPTYHYLSRNMQFACYYASCLEGRFLLNDGLTTEWTHIGEESRCVWVHLPNLFPFGRATVCENDRGMETQYKKGDERPIRMTWREIEYSRHTAVEDIRAELMMRARMIQRDVFPKNPDPIGCSLCEAESFCTRFDTVL